MDFPRRSIMREGRVRLEAVYFILGILTLKASAQFPPASNNNPFFNNDSNQQSTPRDGNPFGVNNNNNRDRDFTPLRDTFPNNNNFQPTPSNNRPGGFNNDPFAGRRDFGGNVFGTPPRYDFSDPSFSSGSLEDRRCQNDWDRFRDTCYRFVESPTTTRNEAQLNCKARGGDLLSVSSMEEHNWVVTRLLVKDRQKRMWYVSTRQSSPNVWSNADGSQMINMDQAFLQDQPIPNFGEIYNYLAYSFSERRGMWGLVKVTGQDIHQFICEWPLSQVPQTQVENRDFDYGIEIQDPKKIPRGPYFIKEPKPEVFDISRGTPISYVTLTCVAGGWPAPTYQWLKEEYRNNTLISTPIDPLRNPKYTVSGGSLVIHEPKQKEDRGNYHCVASNEFGSIISETVSLSFGYIAEFIPTRAVEYANQFWGKAIYCDPPQHFPGVHYYWSRDFFPNLLEEDQRVFVSYDGNLYISAVDISDRGKYSCNVQSVVSDSGRNGPFFSLQIVPHGNPQQLKFPNNFPKVFPEAPKAGGTVRLECVAFGYPVPSYNWTLKGSSLPRNAQLSNYNRVITIKNVTVSDQGEYVCRAWNSRLYVESSVTLSIQAAPDFSTTAGLENKHMDKDENLTWTCEALGIPPVSYQWYRDGKLLSRETLPPQDVGRYFVQDNVLTIRNLDEERDAGMYQCRANNSLAAKFSSAQLRVLLLRPSFKKRPLDTEILAAENGNLTIKCDPEAAPKPRITWKKDGNFIGAGGRRRILLNGNLYINPVSRDDQGLYTCIAQNSRGQDESSGRLTVLRGPILLDQPVDRISYTVGSQLSLRCRADADESLDLSYIWRHNELRIDPKNPRVWLDPRSGYLEVFNVTLSDKGDYECEVVSWVGRLRSRTRVDIRGPPGPPGGVEAFDLTATNGTIRWTDGATNGLPAILYTIEGKAKTSRDDLPWEVLVRNVTAFEADRTVGPRVGDNLRKEFKLANVLSPWVTYEFRVIAANELGYGLPSTPSPQYNTLPAPPFIAPRNVSGGGGKTNSLTITWQPLPKRDQNAPGIYYKIFWRRFREDIEEEYQFLVLEKFGNIGTFAVQVPSNYYYTKYQVRVQAFNDRGRGPISEAQNIYSAEDMPQSTPAEVKPMAHNSTAIKIRWTPVDETREKIRGELLGYRIRYWKKKDNNLYDPEALNYLSRSKESEAMIVGLIPNTYYYVQVMAYNSAGPGPASEPIYERTLKKAPQKPPTSVIVSALDPSTIVVTWRYVAPSIDEEALSGYIIRIWEADQDITKAKDYQISVGSKLEKTITGLEPAKMYTLRVLAYSKGGDGKMSSPAKEFILGDPEALRSGTLNSYKSESWASNISLFAIVCFFTRNLLP